MRSGGGKAKGSAFERLVCSKLSLWMSNGERDDLFWRSAMSGGRATNRFKKGASVKVQMGDICSVDPLGFPLTNKYYVECKSYTEFRMDGFILSRKGPLQQFWDRTKEEAIRYHRSPLLICRQNNLPTFVLLPIPWRTAGPSKLAATVLHQDTGCAIMLFDDFLTTKPPL